MLDLEKLKQDFADGRAVNPQNIRILIEEIERLQDENKKLKDIYEADLFFMELTGEQIIDHATSSVDRLKKLEGGEE